MNEQFIHWLNNLILCFENVFTQIFICSFYFSKEQLQKL